MKILFLHGWTSVVGGRKPTYLLDNGQQVINPSLPDDDFEAAVQIAQDEYDRHLPDVIVGSSRGGAVAMNLEYGDTPLVLLCPAWKRWGTATTVPSNTAILHSRQDEVIPFSESEALVKNSGFPRSMLLGVGSDHRLADEEPLEKMLHTCQFIVGTTPGHEFVDVSVYHLEMLAASSRSVQMPREGLRVLHAKQPSVSYYRFLYNTVGSNYHWCRRGKLADAELAAIISSPQNELHVLCVEGAPAGFAELNRCEHQVTELVQFGLMPEFIGQGLGKWFLQWTIDKVWSWDVSRFWLHTCSLDHPAALPMYRKAGFVLCHEETVRRPL